MGMTLMKEEICFSLPRNRKQGMQGHTGKHQGQSGAEEWEAKEVKSLYCDF